MLRIGLTGGLAAGKSTVAAHLARQGAVVFDADRIVAELYRPGGAGAAAARELFGEEVLDAHGAVDREKVSRIVFRDAPSRLALEARIHPLVRAEIERRFSEAERQGASVAVAEASQLLEAQTEDRYDRVLLVVAPEDLRLRRWTARGGDAEGARRRIEAQIDPDEARARVTDVIVNDGTLEDLQRKVEELFHRWTKSPRSIG